MYHTLTFSSTLDFALFSQEIGSWWYELATLRGVESGEQGRCHALYYSETAIGKEHQIDIQGCPSLLSTSFNNEDKASTTEAKEDNEEIVPLDSQLGQDALALLAHYFPGATITGIESTYSRGLFVGDYSIHMTCAVTHPIIQQVEMAFTQEDVPGRPDTWQELCLLHIDLYLTRFTLLNKSNGHPMTYGLPGMYQEEITKWCDTHGGKHDHSELYGYVQTPHLFIIKTEELDDGAAIIKEIKRDASDIMPVTVEMNVYEHKEYQAWLASKNVPNQAVGSEFDPFLDSSDLP